MLALIITVLLASSVIGSPNVLPQNSNILPRQTLISPSITADSCAMAFQPLMTNAPDLPAEFQSFWAKNNPMTKGCLAPAPASLTAEFSSVYSSLGSWWKTNSAVVASIISNCPQYNFGGLGGNSDSTTATAPALPLSIPLSMLPQWASYINFTALPACSTSQANNTMVTTGLVNVSSGTGLPIEATMSVATQTTTGATTKPTVPVVANSGQRKAYADAVLGALVCLVGGVFAI